MGVNSGIAAADVCLAEVGLIEKKHVLLVIIELFSLGVTAEAL